MKAETLGTFLGALIVGIIEALFAGLFMMWGLHNAHHYLSPAIPALGFFESLLVSVPFALFLYVSTRHNAS